MSEELPTVIHVTRGELIQQRAELIARTGMDEETLRSRAESWQLYPEHLMIWDTIEGIDYLLGDE
ncbi:hypothetical protein [Streptomyces sp. URMC 129]|uniref:hypothetical protein n=1 Tax=Streptomyces sp. URMC 129 TaxID=3423407 RepID=UPI003F1C0733